MARIVGIELRQLDLSLVTGVETAAGTHHRRPLLVARVSTSDGDGWGECGALESGTLVDPALDAVQPVAETMAGRLVRQGADAAAAQAPASSGPGRLARALFEMALFDATAIVAGRSLAQHLGAERDQVEVGAMVGIPTGRDAGALLARAEAALDPVGDGARRLRLKIAPGWDRQPVAVVRERFPEVALQVDANGSYRAREEGEDGLEALRALEPFALTAIEQPLPPDDLEAHAWLAARLAVPVALDESLWSLERVEEALRIEAMSVACLKPARLGGLGVAVEAQARCRVAGVHTFVGGLFESGLGRSANVGLAALEGFDLPGDLTSPVAYLSAQPFTYPAVMGGAVAVPTGPGIGATPDMDVIDRLTVWQRWFGQEAT